MLVFWFCFLCFLFCVFCLTIAIMQIISARKHKTNETLVQNASPKIGAEVSSRFYDEIKRYCTAHHMTISDLIRKSVRAYMDTNR